MIYIYSIVTKPLTSKILSDETCPVCSARGSLELTLYMKYISWLLPMYGVGRRTGVHCTHCDHVVKSPGASVFAKKNYSDSIQRAINELRSSHKRTVWQLLYPWSFWLVIFGLALTVKVYSSIQNIDKNKAKEMLANPQAGDVYKSLWEIDRQDTKLGVKVKITRISGDTLFAVCSKKHMAASANYYDEAEWDKLNAGFDHKEYKILRSQFVKGAEFFEYANEANGNSTLYLGYVLGKGSSNLSFDVLER